MGRPAGAGSSVTMADVAAHAGVSRALVSIVFRGVPGASEESRARVMRAAEELGYRLDHRARLLGRGRSRTLGVVFGLRHEFHGELVEALYAETEGLGWDLSLGATAPSRSEEHAVRSLLEQRCEALVLLGSGLGRASIEELAAQVPVVLGVRHVRQRSDGPAYDLVRTDDVAGARLAVEHLVGLGHQRLVHVDGGRASGAAERRRGFARAVQDAAVSGRVVAGGTDEAAGEGAVADLLAGRASARPTGVVAFNDHCAVGVLGALRGSSVRVPEDLSLVGYDDSRVAALASVALTTVRQDSGRLAADAVALAVSRIDEPGRPGREVVVAPSLVQRSTSGGRP